MWMMMMIMREREREREEEGWGDEWLKKSFCSCLEKKKKGRKKEHSLE